MSKLTYEDKKEIVRLYIDEGMGYGSIAKKYEVSPTTIKRIVDFYNAYGEEALKRKQYTTYSPEFKYEVVSRALNGESKTMLATEYQITVSSISIWLEKYNDSGYDGLKDRKRGRPPKMKEKEKVTEETKDIEITEINLDNLDPKVREYILSQQEEIDDLSLEIAILKKVQALAQRKK